MKTSAKEIIKRDGLVRKAIAMLMFISLCSFLFSCISISNDQIIKEVKKCEDAGLKASLVRNGMTSRIISVECIPLQAEDYK